MPGFPPETLTFLADLADHNDKAWFDANRDRYERYWLTPAREFVEEAGQVLTDLAPEVNAEPRVNGSIFRIHRDIRFSRDKTPYKEHLDLWFWEGERRTAVSGLFLRITPAGVTTGAGAHTLDRDRLARLRELVVDPVAGAQLLEVVDTVEDTGADIGGEELKTLPRGMATDDPDRARLLRHKALYAHRAEPVPGILAQRRFVQWVARRWEQQLPLHRWLIDHLG